MLHFYLSSELDEGQTGGAAKWPLGSSRYLIHHPDGVQWRGRGQRGKAMGKSGGDFHSRCVWDKEVQREQRGEGWGRGKRVGVVENWMEVVKNTSMKHRDTSILLYLLIAILTPVSSGGRLRGTFFIWTRRFRLSRPKKFRSKVSVVRQSRSGFNYGRAQGATSLSTTLTSRVHMNT